MTWPTQDTSPDISVSNVDAGTDSPASARADLNAAIAKINGLKALINQIIAYGAPFLASGGAIAGAASTTPVAVPFATSISIDCSQSNVFYIGQLTANTTLSFTNFADGQTVMLRFVQNSSSAKTVTLPTGWKVTSDISLGASSVNWLMVTMVNPAGHAEGTWSWVAS